MDVTTLGIVAGIVAALLAGFKALLPYLSKAPKLSAWLAALLIVSVVILAGMVLQGCRSSIPVVVKQQNFQCSTVVTNSQGEIDMQQSECIRVDGDQVEAPAGAGDDDVKLPGLGGAGERAERLPGDGQRSSGLPGYELRPPLALLN